MTRLVCSLLGHRVVIRWFWMSWRRRGVECRAECERCGKLLTRLSTPPLQKKLR